MSKGRSGQDQLALQPGIWAVAVLASFDELAITYRDIGHTAGAQVFQRRQGDGFAFIRSRSRRTSPGWR